MLSQPLEVVLGKPCLCPFTRVQRRRGYRTAPSARTASVHALPLLGGAPSDLWASGRSSVQELNLETMKFLHSMSYGHPNPRSVVVIVYHPDYAACRAVEDEIERLAQGLETQPSLLVAKLNVTSGKRQGGAMTDVGHFASGALQNLGNSLPISHRSLPPSVQYTLGCGMAAGTELTAEALLAALNSYTRKVMPSRPPMTLGTLAPPGPQQASPRPSAVAPTAISPAAQAGTTSSHQEQLASFQALRPQQQQPDSRTGSTSHGGPSPAPTESHATLWPSSTGPDSMGAAGRQAGQAVADPLQQGQAAQTLVPPSPWQGSSQVYWTGGKVAFWAGCLALSMAMWWWDRIGGPALERRQLVQRQAIRAEKGIDAFDGDTNAEDLIRIQTMGMRVIDINSAPPATR
ncbi:hypothetical protein QJQ45_003732 [Haematococcus lacustris]|nr:hypothetical protein QJQ45_003732 [Haematococcus lacustris]